MHPQRGGNPQHVAVFWLIVSPQSQCPYWPAKQTPIFLTTFQSENQFLLEISYQINTDVHFIQINITPLTFLVWSSSENQRNPLNSNHVNFQSSCLNWQVAQSQMLHRNLLHWNHQYAAGLESLPVWWEIKQEISKDSQETTVEIYP